MNRMKRCLSLAVVLLLAATPPSAGAHQGNPSFRSIVHGFAKPVPGLSVQVIGYDAFMQLANKSGKTVVIYGYDGEPYARLLADGTVQTNQRSPALYLNEDRFARVTVPPIANPKAPPEWKTLDKTSQLIWHDHRMHWMALTTPPQVKDKHRKTKIFDYRIPLRIGSQPNAIVGTLYWVGEAHGFPLPALISIPLIVLLAIAGVYAIRRRRESEGEVGTGGKEAW